MRSLKYRTSAESFPWESVLIYRCKGGGGWGGRRRILGGIAWFSEGMERGFVCANSWGGEGSSTIYSDQLYQIPSACPPSFSPLQKSIRLHETSKGSTYIITGITISIRPQSFGSGIILETLRALHFFHVVLRKFRVAIRGAAAMIQNKSCNATFPQDTPGYNELENSWHALLLSRFFSQNLYFHLPLSRFSVTWS